MLLNDVTDAIRTAQGYGCDYLSFSEPFRIAYPDVYERLNWSEVFPGASFSAKIAVSVKEHEGYDYNPTSARG
jgi:hypothetical protein